MRDVRRARGGLAQRLGSVRWTGSGHDSQAMSSVALGIRPRPGASSPRLVGRRPASQASITKLFTLPNGLTVVLSEDHSTPIVHLQMWYHVGSKNEKPGKHRLRPPLRAPDVQGIQERRAGSTHVYHFGGRRAGQRVHDRGRDGLLGYACRPNTCRWRSGSRPIAWRRSASIGRRSPTSGRS